MHTIKLNIQDSIYTQVMSMLKSLNPEDIEIIEDSQDLTDNKDLDYGVWAENEIKNIGKIGLDSKSFVDDDEDYSKW